MLSVEGLLERGRNDSLVREIVPYKFVEFPIASTLPIFLSLVILSYCYEHAGKFDSQLKSHFELR